MFFFPFGDTFKFSGGPWNDNLWGTKNRRFIAGFSVMMLDSLFKLHLVMKEK